MSPASLRIRRLCLSPAFTPLGWQGYPAPAFSSLISTASVLSAVSVVVVMRFHDFFSFDHESVLVDLRREVYRK
jgi:hypothetical protein